MRRFVASLLRDDRWLAPVFLLCALPVAIWLALMVPTGEVPDEFAHAVRAESVLHGALTGFRRPRLDFAGKPMQDSGVMANPGLLAAAFAAPVGATLPDKRVTQSVLDRLRNLAWAPEPVYVSAPNTAAYPPLFYLPAAAGMKLAMLRGSGPYASLLAARLAGAGAYLALGTAALLLAVRVRPILFTMLVLPMSLTMAASPSQDGPMIATAALAAALLSRAPAPAGRAYIGGGALLAAVIMAKPVYIPLAAAMLTAGDFDPRPRAASLRRRLLAGLLVVLPGILWFAYVQAVVATPFVKGAPVPAGPLWPGPPGQVFAATDAMANLSVLLHRPSLILALPYELLITHGEWRLKEMIGVLGLLDVTLPFALYAAWTRAGVAALAACAIRPPGAGRPALWKPTLMLAACIASVVLVCIAQYLTWTLVGAPAIEGVQGRYFLPILAFAGFAIPAFRLPAGPVLRMALTVPAIACGLAGLVVLPMTVLAAYYIR